jgi:hypothetical protein
MFRSHFATISASGSVADSPRRAADRLLWLRLARALLDEPDVKGFRPREAGAGELALACRNDRFVRSLFWARADDVAKRRRQGLVVCRAASPFEGLFDARPGVTLAPTFTAWVACQSRTLRA